MFILPQKIRRQEELARKQQEIQAEMERKKQAEREQRDRQRAEARRLAAEEKTSPAPSPSPSPQPPPAPKTPQPPPESDDDDEEVVPFRSDSPPIPAMRGKNQEQVVRELSGMREQLDRQQEEHDSVWSGLVEV